MKPLTGKRMAELKAWYLYYEWMIIGDDLKEALLAERKKLNDLK
jgi:hypothetical protein